MGKQLTLALYIFGIAMLSACAIVAVEKSNEKALSSISQCAQLTFTGNAKIVLIRNVCQERHHFQIPYEDSNQGRQYLYTTPCILPDDLVNTELNQFDSIENIFEIPCRDI